MARKGENIRKRKDGRWEARFTKIDCYGNSSIGYVYAESYTEVKNKRKEIVLALEKQRQETEGTFNLIIDDFLKQAEYSVKPSTFNHYKMMIDAHIRPHLGKKKYEILSSVDIENFTVDMLKDGRTDGKGGLSTKTVKDLLSVLRRILKYGVNKELIPFTVLNFTTPKAYTQGVCIFDAEETEILKQHSAKKTDPSYLGILVCLYAGLRLGEICALQWKDIDFENKTITIDKTMIRLHDKESGHTRVYIEKPKTLSSNRVIPMPEALTVHLRARKAAYDEAYVTTGMMRYNEPRTYYERYKRILKECGISPHSFHCLRHTFATNCVQQGFDPKTLSEILGHSDVKVTFDKYIHPSMEMKRKYMEMLK